MRLRRPIRWETTRLLGEDPSTGKVPEVKWIHIASEGEYKGHPSGPFALNAEVFATMVGNFKADPRYKLGDDGKGASPVVPYDYEHASEMAAFLGSIPKEGTPAPAWALDLEVRSGADGKKQLWALTKLGETIRGQIERHEYQFVSMAFAATAKDPVSGADIGPKITSIAFTNQPFLRDLTPVPIAATVRGLGDLYAYPSGSPEDAFEQLRTLLGLPTSSEVSAVVAEVEKVLAWASGQGVPPQGLEVDELVACFRRALGLPVTVTIDEVRAEIRKASEALIPGSTNETGETGSEGSDDMALSDLGKKIAAILTKRRTALSNVVSVMMLQDDADAERVVEELASSGSDLNSILGALGVADPGKALESIAQLQAAKSKLDGVQQELDAAMATQAKVEEAQATADVNAALKAKGWDETARAALTAHHARFIAESVAPVTTQLKANPATPNPGKLLADARDAGRKKFLSAYSVPDAEHAHLLSLIAAGPGGAQIAPPPVQPPPAGALTMSQTNGPQQTGGEQVIDLSAHPGRNETEQIVAYLQSKNPQLQRQDAFRQCRALRESGARFTGSVQTA